MDSMTLKLGQVQLKLEVLGRARNVDDVLQIQPHMEPPSGVWTPYSQNGTASIINKSGNNVKYFFAFEEKIFLRRPAGPPGEIGIDKKTRIWWNGGRISHAQYCGRDRLAP